MRVRKLTGLSAMLAVCLVAAAAATSSFPQGRYSLVLSPADFSKYGGKMDANFPHPWVITIRNGRWQTNEHPAWGGPYIVRGNLITFVVEHPLKGKGRREGAKWSYYRGKLSFHDYFGPRYDTEFYLTRPWQRIGR